MPISDNHDRADSIAVTFLPTTNPLGAYPTVWWCGTGGVVSVEQGRPLRYSPKMSWTSSWNLIFYGEFGLLSSMQSNVSGSSVQAQSIFFFSLTEEATLSNGAMLTLPLTNTTCIVINARSSGVVFLCYVGCLLDQTTSLLAGRATGFGFFYHPLGNPALGFPKTFGYWVFPSRGGGGPPKVKLFCRISVAKFIEKC